MSPTYMNPKPLPGFQKTLHKILGEMPWLGYLPTKTISQPICSIQVYQDVGSFASKAHSHTMDSYRNPFSAKAICKVTHFS